MANESRVSEELIVQHYKDMSIDELEAEKQRLEGYIEIAKLRVKVIGKMIAAQRNVLDAINEQFPAKDQELAQMVEQQPVEEKGPVAQI